MKQIKQPKLIRCYVNFSFEGDNSKAETIQKICFDNRVYWSDIRDKIIHIGKNFLIIDRSLTWTNNVRAVPHGMIGFSPKEFIEKFGNV